MRHLRSILYALVLAPAIWVLAGVGFTHDLSSRGREFFAAESISGLLLLVFAGILYAILAFAPVSPAGPVLAGAVYLGVAVWAWNSPEAYAGLWPAEVSKEGFDLSRPGYGLAVLLAIPLLGTALSARRWARYEPPVLPIIGEIGRFRGAAQAPGIPVSIEETTVLQTARNGDPAVPLTAARPDDRTVPMPPASADPTMAIPPAAASAPAGLTASTPPATSAASAPAGPTAATPPATSAASFPTGRTIATGPADADTEDLSVALAPAVPAADGADPTAAMPAATALPDDRTVTMPAATEERIAAATTAPVAAAKPALVTAPADLGQPWEPTIAVRTPEAEPTTVFVVSSDETTTVAARPAPSGPGKTAQANNSAITANSRIAEKASADQPATVSAEPATAAGEEATTAFAATPATTAGEEATETLASPPAAAAGEEATETLASPPAAAAGEEATETLAAPPAAAAGEEATTAFAKPGAEEATTAFAATPAAAAGAATTTASTAAPTKPAGEEATAALAGSAEEAATTAFAKVAEEEATTAFAKAGGEGATAAFAETADEADEEETHRLPEAAAIEAAAAELEDLTAPLRLSAPAVGGEPTAYIPAQRRPYPTEA
ncbi:hypothetical protein OHA21_43365 [Actinoplanes sp. NBC_00393]|uniref:hypothetical protein n=1 Tax=Actinoplanes sp. NBC_00393 TaxID=2975953 RepID=UPI002E23BB69